MDTENIKDIVGEEEFESFKNVSYANEVLFIYLRPVLSIIVMMTNLAVFLLCLGIYSRNRRKTTNKPAFVFIGWLALMDTITGFITLPQPPIQTIFGM